MSRYPLSQKRAEFAREALDIVGSKGWQGRLAAKWNHYADEFSDKADKTRKLYVSKFRKSVRDLFESLPEGDERRAVLGNVIGYMDFPEGLNEALHLEYKRSVKNRSRNLKEVYDYRALVGFFDGLLGNENIRVKALALMFLTGRRFVEVLSLGEFRGVIKEEKSGRVQQKYLVGFKGQAKTRGADGTKYGQRFSIPVLAPSGRIIEAVEAIRASSEGVRWQGMTQKELNASDSGRMNHLLRGTVLSSGLDEPEVFDGLVIKDLRCLYAEICYEELGPKTMTKGVHFSQTLGHGEDDMYSSLSYMKFVLGTARSNRAEAQKEIQRIMDGIDDGGEVIE